MSAPKKHGFQTLFSKRRCPRCGGAVKKTSIVSTPYRCLRCGAYYDFSTELQNGEPTVRDLRFGGKRSLEGK